MGWVCRTNGAKRTHIGYWWESGQERNHYENQDLGWWIILKWILEGWHWVIRNELIWLKKGTSGGLLWARNESSCSIICWEIL
jgi:hypothetical protein